MIILDVEQGSDQWLDARLGIPTASCFSNIITPAGKPSASQGPYMGKLLEEYATGVPTLYWESDDMKNGTSREPEARDYFSFLTGNEVEQVGLIYLDDRKLISCSPDGLISKNEGLELKCPKGSTHLGYMSDPSIGLKKYKCQVQGNLWVSGRDKWHWMSYHSDYPEVLKEVGREESFIKLMCGEVEAFVDRMLEQRERISIHRA